MPSLVTSGELRSRITILRPVGTTSATGGVVEGTPQTFASSLPARIQSALGNESLQAGALTSTGTHVVTIRYLSGVQPYMSVTFETRTFQILSIIDADERHIEMQLVCAEIQ